MPQDKTPLDPRILPSIAAIMTIGIGLIATGLDVKVTPENISILSLAFATLFVIWLQSREVTKKDEEVKKKDADVKRAENVVPGITTLNGPTEKRTLIINDPTKPGPPMVSNPEKPSDEPSVGDLDKKN